MAVNSTTTVGVTLTGDIAGTLTIPLSTNGTSPGQRQQVVLAAGNNTLTPPSGTLKAVIIPPTGSTNGKTLKGVAGDTGIPMSLTEPTVLSFPAGAGAFVINSVGAETLEVFWL
jgi:hypothetical protein